MKKWIIYDSHRVSNVWIWTVVQLFTKCVVAFFLCVHCIHSPCFHSICLFIDFLRKFMRNTMQKSAISRYIRLRHIVHTDDRLWFWIGRVFDGVALCSILFIPLLFSSVTDGIFTEKLASLACLAVCLALCCSACFRLCTIHINCIYKNNSLNKWSIRNRL